MTNKPLIITQHFTLLEPDPERMEYSQWKLKELTMIDKKDKVFCKDCKYVQMHDYCIDDEIVAFCYPDELGYITKFNPIEGAYEVRKQENRFSCAKQNKNFDCEYFKKKSILTSEHKRVAFILTLVALFGLCVGLYLQSSMSM